MKQSLIQIAQREIEAKQRDLDELKCRRNLNEQLYLALDSHPGQEFVKSTYLLAIKDRDYIAYYAAMTSFKNVLPALEFIENLFDAQFISYDNAEDGTRTYEIRSDQFQISLNYIVSPDESFSEATCRRVVVGEKVETKTIKTPIYELICD